MTRMILAETDVLGLVGEIQQSSYRHIDAMVLANAVQSAFYFMLKRNQILDLELALFGGLSAWKMADIVSAIHGRTVTFIPAVEDALVEGPNRFGEYITALSERQQVRGANYPLFPNGGSKYSTSTLRRHLKEFNDVSWETLRQSGIRHTCEALIEAGIARSVAISIIAKCADISEKEASDVVWGTIQEAGKQPTTDEHVELAFVYVEDIDRGEWDGLSPEEITTLINQALQGLDASPEKVVRNYVPQFLKHYKKRLKERGLEYLAEGYLA